MTFPMVIVTRDDTRDPLLIEWFENEDGFYNGDPLAVVEFDRWRDVWSAWAKKNARTETRLVTARTLLALVLDAGADVQRLATHTVSELGAHPEPVVRCDGTRTCREEHHRATCLGLYRTEDEVRLSVVPSVEVLQQRRRDEITLRGLEAIIGGGS